MKHNKLQRKYDCPVCGLLEALSELGSYDICPQCNWEDDPVQLNDPDFKGGANNCSLNEAREEWKNRGHT